MDPSDGQEPTMVLATIPFGGYHPDDPISHPKNQEA